MSSKTSESCLEQSCLKQGLLKQKPWLWCSWTASAVVSEWSSSVQSSWAAMSTVWPADKEGAAWLTGPHSQLLGIKERPASCYLRHQTTHPDSFTHSQKKTLKSACNKNLKQLNAELPFSLTWSNAVSVTVKHIPLLSNNTPV
jgi:hypothetical protein